jgi:aspartate carbamoyltransferase catalytic subunit
MKHLTSINDLSKEQAIQILDSADSMGAVNAREIKKLPTLRGKTIVNLFYENSTRTRISFELAAKRLSADVINFAAATSSVSKGESLKDTAQTLEALGADAIVIRHPMSGSAHQLATRGWVSSSIINAGDGSHEHPTQALLDACTIRQSFNLEQSADLSGLRVLIVGDILHSRVARSNLLLLKKLGAEVEIAAPATLMPAGLDKLGALLSNSFEESLEHKPNVVMMLRVQRERMNGSYFPSSREYAQSWSLSGKRLAMVSKDSIIMHPGPMNRGFEISSAAADDPRSKILDQVRNGLSVRMAVLHMCLSNGEL